MFIKFILTSRKPSDRKAFETLYRSFIVSFFTLQAFKVQSYCLTSQAVLFELTSDFICHNCLANELVSMFRLFNQCFPCTEATDVRRTTDTTYSFRHLGNQFVLDVTDDDLPF